jgi:hypothetical protein
MDFWHEPAPVFSPAGGECVAGEPADAFAPFFSKQWTGLCRLNDKELG